MKVNSSLIEKIVLRKNKIFSLSLKLFSQRPGASKVVETKASKCDQSQGGR